MGCIALSSDGARDLQAIDEDDDILTAMACELVKNKGIGESVESIWRNLA